VLEPASSLSSSGAQQVSFERVKLELPLRAYADLDPYPIPVTEDREGYYGDFHYDWWLSGLYDYLAVKQTLTRFGGSLKPGDAVFELGCASGRVLRHLGCGYKFAPRRMDPELFTGAHQGLSEHRASASANR